MLSVTLPRYKVFQGLELPVQVSGLELTVQAVGLDLSPEPVLSSVHDWKTRANQAAAFTSQERSTGRNPKI